MIFNTIEIKRFVLPSLLLITFVFPVQSEIITDNSFETEQSIPSDNNIYEIKADYGSQKGPNLFHSFKTFNIEKGMTANFTGPSSIQRIISRVTGGDISHINGSIKSSIQGVDFFLLNPNGFIFKESARLEIDGSFYVSTADYLQMTESEKFMTGSTEISGLVTSLPYNFGFLDENIASIIFKGLEAIKQNDCDEKSDSFNDINTKFPKDNGLTVSGNSEFCVIGGQIIVEKGISIAIKDSTSQKDISDNKPAIQFVSIKSQANVSLNDMLKYTQNTKFDNISIKGSILNVSGQSVGGISIVGNDILVDNCIFYMDNFGTQNAFPLKMKGNNITFLNHAKIVSSTFSNGDAAPIQLSASSNILFKETYSSIYSFSVQNESSNEIKMGNTSNMTFLAKNFYLQDGSRILSRTHSSGNCSDISIQVDDTIRLYSVNYLDNQCSIFFDTYESGNAGKIDMKAKYIDFSNGAKLSVSTKGSGNGGSIFINAEDFYLKGLRIDSLSQPYQGSRIFLESYGKDSKAGNSGKLFIQANRIFIEDGAQITAETYGYGRGGDITLIATENIVLKGMDGRKIPTMINATCTLFRRGSGFEKSGNVTLKAKNISLSDGAWISTQTEGNGNAGTIDIKADQKLELSGECLSINNIDKDKMSSCIISSARPKSKGNGGKISVTANDILLTDGAYIETGTSSSGNAGEIEIQANTLTLMKTSSEYKSSIIQSNTHATQLDSITDISGKGGKISINVNNVNLFDGARISTSSIADVKNSGMAGDIHMNSEGTLRISGQNTYELNDSEQFSGIYARSQQINQAIAGEAGNIKIVVRNLVMDNNGLISTSSNGLGNAGDIDIQTRQSILLTHSRIASESIMPDIDGQKGGEAGSIKINSGGDFQLFQSAHITTNAVSSGGGKIDIHNNNALTLINSDITTNVRQGDGNGGDINIRSDLTVMNHSIISANAYAGDGGAIYIYTRHMIQSTDSRIEATSERGNDGTVEIETPDIGDNQNLLNLSDNFLNSTQIVNTLCDQTNPKGSIHFVIHSPYIPNLSATWYPFSTNTSLRLLSASVTDQFDNFAKDFSDDVLYQVEQ